MWSFVGNKRRQRWLWYAWEPRLKCIIAHAFGRRSKKTLRKLLGLLSGFNVAFWCTDNLSAYDMLPNEKHITGKLYTQRIERENLNLRNRLKRLYRKTLGYSKSPEMHDKIIGTKNETVSFCSNAPAGPGCLRTASSLSAETDIPLLQ